MEDFSDRMAEKLERFQNDLSKLNFQVKGARIN